MRTNRAASANIRRNPLFEVLLALRPPGLSRGVSSTRAAHMVPHPRQSLRRRLSPLRPFVCLPARCAAARRAVALPALLRVLHRLRGRTTPAAPCPGAQGPGGHHAGCHRLSSRNPSTHGFTLPCSAGPVSTLLRNGFKSLLRGPLRAATCSARGPSFTFTVTFGSNLLFSTKLESTMRLPQHRGR